MFNDQGLTEFGINQAGLGDPASDFGRLLGPQGYGLEALQRCEPIYPGFARLFDRMQFYAHISSLQDTLAKTERQRWQQADGFANRQTFLPE